MQLLYTEKNLYTTMDRIVNRITTEYMCHDNTINLLNSLSFFRVLYIKIGDEIRIESKKEYLNFYENIHRGVDEYEHRNVF